MHWGTGLEESGYASELVGVCCASFCKRRLRLADCAQLRGEGGLTIKRAGVAGVKEARYHSELVEGEVGVRACLNKMSELNKIRYF